MLLLRPAILSVNLSSPACFSSPLQAEAKAKAYNTCIAPQAAHRSCSGAVHVTDRANVQPVGHIGSACAHRLTYDQPAIHSPGLPFNGLHPRNPCITALILIKILNFVHENVKNCMLISHFASAFGDFVPRLPGIAI